MSLHPEDIAATALARWLEERGAPPEELDDEVLEAVYALRPELAPPPTVTIDEILATLDQAGPLGGWLEQAGAEAPDTLDDDVAEAIYALSPARAPGPNVSIDDILARLTAGPLAPTAPVEPAEEEHMAEIVPFPSRPQVLPEPANVAPPSFQGRPFQQARRNGRWLPWVVGSGAMSAMAAAALFAVMVLPQMDMSPAVGPASEMASAPAPVTADAPMPSAAPEAEPAPEVTAQAAPAKELAPPPKADALAKAPEATGWWDGQPAPKTPAVSTEKDMRPADALAAAEAPAPPPVVATTPATPVEEGEEAVADLFGGDADDSEDFAQQRTQDAAGGGLFGGRPARETVADEDLGAARGGAAPIETETIALESKKAKSAKPMVTRRSASASNSSIPEAAYDEIPEAPAAAAPATTTTGTSGTVSIQDRLVAVEQQAEAFAAQGRPLDAARTISANIVPPASVGHAYAARATRWYLDAGRPDLAATTCDLGLALGATPSAALSAACDATRAANAPADNMNDAAQ